MPEPIPEHIVDQMAKEVAKLIAAVYPRMSVDELERNTRAALLRDSPRIQVVDGKWHWPGAKILSIPVAWVDLELGRAQVGDEDGPHFFFEEKPKRSEWEDAYWEGRDVS